MVYGREQSKNILLYPKFLIKAVHLMVIIKIIKLKQFGDASEKFIPKEILELPSDKLKILLDYFIKGDGHIDKNGRIRVWTSSKRLVDNLSEIALKIGWGANILNRGKN